MNYTYSCNSFHWISHSFLNLYITPKFVHTHALTHLHALTDPWHCHIASQTYRHYNFSTLWLSVLTPDSVISGQDCGKELLTPGVDKGAFEKFRRWLQWSGGFLLLRPRPRKNFTTQQGLSLIMHPVGDIFEWHNGDCFSHSNTSKSNFFSPFGCTKYQQGIQL